MIQRNNAQSIEFVWACRNPTFGRFSQRLPGQILRRKVARRNVALRAHELSADAGHPGEPSGPFWTRVQP
jgi:hypothetical protein